MNDKKSVLNKKAAGAGALIGGAATLLVCHIFGGSISQLISATALMSLFGAIVGAISE